MKYTEAKVVFSEIPDEITLAINISGCQVRCPDCHSKYLWEDIGEELNIDSIRTLIDSNKDVTCVAFMGGDSDSEIRKFLDFIKFIYPKIKTAWYSGKYDDINEVNDEILLYLDYLKVGPYYKELGPLNERTTNQKFYKKFNTKWLDITYRFWGESYDKHEVANYTLSLDNEHVNRVNKALEIKLKKYGQKYCPCVSPLAHSRDTICPCLAYRMTGICHCGLYTN